MHQLLNGTATTAYTVCVDKNTNIELYSDIKRNEVYLQCIFLWFSKKKQPTKSICLNRSKHHTKQLHSHIIFQPLTNKSLLPYLVRAPTKILVEIIQRGTRQRNDCLTAQVSREAGRLKNSNILTNSEFVPDMI